MRTMDYREIDELFLIKRKKKITNKQCAEACGCTSAFVGQFFNHKSNMSEEKQEKLKEFIESIPEYVYFRVPINKSK